LLGPQSFEDKLNKQLAEASDDLRRLASEMLVLFVIFVGWNFRTESKLNLVAAPLPEGVSLPETEPVHSALAERIGSAGPGWLFNRASEFGFLLDAMAAFKAVEPPERKELLDDPWQFEEWIDQLPGGPTKQMRHMLLHLLSQRPSNASRREARSGQ
jgi:5-methylcytosine-specific restriction enzyme B